MKVNTLSEFGKVVRKLRIDKEVALKTMADEFRVSSTYISLMETDKKSISLNYLRRVVTYLRPSKGETKTLLESLVNSKTKLCIPLDNLSKSDKVLVVELLLKLELEKSDVNSSCECL